MSLDQAQITTDAELPKTPLQESAIKWISMAAVAILLAWSWTPVEMYRAVSLYTDANNMAQFAAGFLKPNFLDWDIYVSDMIVTIQIAIWGTFLAIRFGIPFASLSSSNICPTRSCYC